MLPPTVKLISTDEKQKALDIFTLAFANDPAMRWLMPEAGVYLKNLGAAQMALGGERHGFEVVGRIQSGSSPVITPMLRPAR